MELSFPELFLKRLGPVILWMCYDIIVLEHSTNYFKMNKQVNKKKKKKTKKTCEITIRLQSVLLKLIGPAVFGATFNPRPPMGWLLQPPRFFLKTAFFAQ